MSERIYTIEHEGKEIWFTDWRDLLDAKEFVKIIWETSNIVIKNNKTNLLEVIDIRGSYFNVEVFKALKDAAKATRPYNRKKCVVGEFSATRLMMLKFLNNFSKDKVVAFNTLQEAKEWLVS